MARWEQAANQTRNSSSTGENSSTCSGRTQSTRCSSSPAGWRTTVARASTRPARSGGYRGSHLGHERGGRPPGRERTLPRCPRSSSLYRGAVLGPGQAVSSRRNAPARSRDWGRLGVVEKQHGEVRFPGGTSTSALVRTLLERAFVAYKDEVRASSPMPLDLRLDRVASGRGRPRPQARMALRLRRMPQGNPGHSRLTPLGRVALRTNRGRRMWPVSEGEGRAPSPSTPTHAEPDTASSHARLS